MPSRHDIVRRRWRPPLSAIKAPTSASASHQDRAAPWVAHWLYTDACRYPPRTRTTMDLLAAFSAQRPIELPTPADGESLPVFAALALRRTTREFSDLPLPPQMLANLLWAACGVNRPVGPFGATGRTAASASNSQEIEVYVVTAQGAFLYDAPAHRLLPVTAQDLRVLALTPGQRGVAPSAPFQLIYVVDLHRLTHTAGFDEPGLHDPEVQKSYYFIDAGLIAGNVHLYAAARGLGAWFHNCDRAGLARQLRLRDDQRVLFAQSVGYPAQA
jgi:nitroreductase